MGADEELPAYFFKMQSPDHWIILEPPVRQLSTCAIQAIRPKKLPLAVSVRQSKANKSSKDDETEPQAEYRASNEDPITHTLYTNPMFVTPPPCYAGPKGPHEVHLRDLPRYQPNIWTVERLKEHTPYGREEGDVMIIRVTGKGSETLTTSQLSRMARSSYSPE